MSPRFVALGLMLILAGCGADATDGEISTQAACGLTDAELGRFVSIPAGSFTKGDLAIYPEESPSLQLHVDGFEMLSHEVTNREFADFVEATGYVTDAERDEQSDDPAAGSAVFLSPSGSPHNAWSLVKGAIWRAPEGPGSDLEGRWLHPVVHVTLADARAYADWAGARLPSEVEWEYAASLGLPDPARANSGAYGEDGTPVAQRAGSLSRKTSISPVLNASNIAVASR
jgi:formylglycine-generating enzyme required for sulfatase activity